MGTREQLVTSVFTPKDNDMELRNKTRLSRIYREI